VSCSLRGALVGLGAQVGSHFLLQVFLQKGLHQLFQKAWIIYQLVINLFLGHRFSPPFEMI